MSKGTGASFGFRHWDFFRHSIFDIRHSFDILASAFVITSSGMDSRAPLLPQRLLPRGRRRGPALADLPGDLQGKVSRGLRRQTVRSGAAAAWDSAVFLAARGER